MKNIVSILIIVLLSGCTSYAKRYGFVDQSGEVTLRDIPEEFHASEEPKIRIWSNCAGWENTVSVGPFIAIPMPIIPSVPGIIGLYTYENKNAYLHVDLFAPPNESHIKYSVLTLYMDDKKIEPSKIDEWEGYWVISKTQKYRDLKISCKEMQSKEFFVTLKSSEIDFESKKFRLVEGWGVPPL